MTLALLETPVQYDDPQQVKGPSVGEIVTRLGIRKSEHGVTQEIARIISQTYGGNLAIPLTEADKREPLSTANFLVQGIDQHAFRISRTRAEITVPSTDPGKPRADDLARLKRRVFYGMWSVNDMLSIDEKRARWLVAYTKAPVLLRPDMEKRSKTCGGVKWEPRTPLETYSSIPLDSLDIEPEDCIFTYMRTFKWVTDRYPDAARQINVSRMDTEKVKPEDLVDIIEYVDDEVRVLIAAGRGRPNGVVHEAEYGVNGAVIYNIGLNSPNHWAVELIRITNRAGVCPVVIPTRISLDEAKGQFDDALGIFQLLAKMQAMNVNAIAKGIWPDTWMIHAPGKTGRIVKMADGLLGKIGEVADGDLKAFTEQPNPQVMNMLNYLERAIRQNGAMPAEFGGESPTNVRTDKRGLTVDGAQVDYYIAAHQTALERSKKAELERAMAIDLAYFGGPKKKSIFSMWPGVKGRSDYRPRDLFKDDRTVMVSYNYVGLDANGMTVRQGQLLGMGAMSVQTIMEQSPDVIEDAEMERGRVNADQVDKVIWAQMQQPGAITLPDAATLKQLVRGGMEIEDALIKVQAAAQARQASSGAPGTPEGPVQPGSPEAQPGLAPPGAGQEQPTIAPVKPSLKDFQGVLRELSSFKSAGAPQAGTL